MDDEDALPTTAREWAVGRVAEVVVTLADGVASRRGSGYRVGNGQVLTAAHVVAAASNIVVRFDADRPGEWSVLATPVWSSSDVDVAVLGFDPPAGAPTVGPATLGRLGDCRAVIGVEAFGFPRWKWRTRGDGRVFRDLCHAAGSIAVLSNRRSGTLEFTVAAPGYDPDVGVSPWEAMSGAAVWAGSHLIGVVTEHHRREGLSRLTAVRLDRCLDDSVHGSRALADLLAVPDSTCLANVVPAQAGWLTRSGYREQVRDIAPSGGTLDREVELDEMARFCAGDEPYMWWRAGPWAGKSALMSAFVLNPPAGVEVVSFFITARLATQADSNAFTDALLEQLSVIVGETLPASLTPSGRDAYRRALLRAAARQLHQAGRRLVLVIDGLDEDTGTNPGSGLASVASLLPKDPAEGLRIVVASRPAPAIPADVPTDHPLRSCQVHELEISSHATEIAEQANKEIAELFAGDRARRDLIGLITACGGGLTLSELEELTNLPRDRLESLLGGVFGRTIASRTDHSDPYPRQTFLFTHETLRTLAITKLGASLARYRHQIHTWAQTFQEQGWPDKTPTYLLRGYPRMLQGQPDPVRLADLASDRSRQNRLRSVTGGDTAALAEINAAFDVLVNQDDPDLLTAARLARSRYELSSRNADIPTGLPAVWATLGRPARAEALALSITDEERRATALADVARAVAAGDDTDLAVRIAMAVNEPAARATALADVARTIAAAGDPDTAERIAMTITDKYWQARALAGVAQAVAATHDPDAAEGFARSIENEHLRTKALTDLARTVAAAGDPDGAERIATAITDLYLRVRAMAAVVAALTVSGDDDRAAVLAARAESLAIGPANPLRLLAPQALAAAACGDYDRAQHILRGIVDSGRRDNVLSDVALVAVAKGEHHVARRIAAADAELGLSAHGLAAVARAAAVSGGGLLAAALAERVEATVVNIADPQWHAARVAAMAKALAGIGHYDRAEHTATTIGHDRGERADALAVLAEAAAASGDYDRAKRIVNTISAKFPGVRQRALADIAHAAAARGDRDLAGRIAAAITDGCQQMAVLTIVAKAAAAAGDYDVAVRTATAIDDPCGQVQALAAVAMTTATCGNGNFASALVAQAQRITVTIEDPELQASALAASAKAAAASGNRDLAVVLAARAGRLATSIEDYYLQTRVLAAAAEALAASGDYDGALEVADAIGDYDCRDGIYAAVAEAHAASGDYNAAERVATAIPSGSLGWQAATLATVAKAVAASGDYERAAQIASIDMAEDGYWEDRSDALAVIVRVAAAGGDYDRAERIATAVAHPNAQAHVLTELAENVEGWDARRLIARAFSVGPDWLIPLPALAKRFPSIFLQLVDESTET